MSEKKYVDLDNVIDKLEDELGYQGIREELYDLPTADVEEVRHGNWIDVPLNVYDDGYGMNKYNFRTKCSVCEYAMPREYPRFNICPNCGAKMDR